MTIGFNDTYQILKDLVGLAKKAKNKEIVELSLDLQERFFELREQNENLNQKLKEYANNQERIKNSVLIEKDLRFYPKGFFINVKDKPVIPYCSRCWKVDYKLIPIAQYGNYYQYSCPDCKAKICVMDDNGNSIEQFDKGEENGKNEDA